jgi:hypothetical protein
LLPKHSIRLCQLLTRSSTTITTCDHLPKCDCSTFNTLKVKTFYEPNVPSYAALSHTWGKDEVSLQDLAADRRQGMNWTKIQRSSTKAQRLGYEYIWIDTCCIDKTSSAELSEAINSMYRWYQNCDLCIAYLEDIRKESLDIKGLIEDGYRNANIASQLFCYPTFSRSRWFKRGWTLQELIAPLNLYFYGSEWNKIGEKQGLLEDISQITRIDRDVLRGQRALSRKSVAHKMAWASRRETTRVEDLAYCLIGIFEINMPLLCGEGQRAFTRLQQEIMKHTYDHSLFAWNYEFPRQKFPRPSVYGTLFRDVLCFSEGEGVLAPHPSAFDRCSSFMPWNSRAAPYATTNRGL